MQIHAFKITCLTNLHNGSGDESYGVIDNLVQRDAADGLPVIHGPSLKGALREFFEFYQKDLVRHVFGAEPGQQEKGTESNGNYVFHAANLFALPVRTNVTPYVMATSAHATAQFKRMIKYAKLEENPGWLTEIETGQPAEGRPKVFGLSAHNELYLDDFSLIGAIQEGIELPGLKAFLDQEKHIALVHDDDFQIICDDLHLPVRARNQLEKGESKNLWYEQFVPRLSVFYSFVSVPDADPRWEDFQNKITSHPVQIGGNKSVGDGQCMFSLIF